ncbi:MAG: glycine zipper 2TM domain-containing protein [Pseudomonadota bacterium]
MRIGGPNTLLLAVIVSASVTLTGCKTTETAFDNDCKVTGTAIGAVVGGLAAGLLLGKGNGKIGTALVGAAVGGFVGNQLGGLLDCQDQQALATASQSAGDAPVGQKVVWASDTAAVPPAISPSSPSTEIQVAAPTEAAQAMKAKPVPVTKPRPREAVKVSPPSAPLAQPQPQAEPSKQWAAVEPIRSGGQSGMWGWVEPVSAPTTTADGRTCRTLKQVAVEPSGKQHEEEVTSCLNEQREWVLASR